MKKTLLFFLCYPVIMGILAQKEFRFSSTNDSWGGGFTPIYDDLRTYGFQAAFENEGQYKVEAAFFNLTNRYHPDSAVVDELSLLGHYPIYHEKGVHHIGLSLHGGFTLRGPLLGKVIQDGVHEIFGVERSELKYQKGVYFHPQLGYHFTMRLAKLNPTISLNIEQHTSWAIGYSHLVSARLPLHYASKFGSKIQMALGYGLSKNDVSENALLDNVYEAENGFQFHFATEGKRLFYFMDVYLESGFSTGGIGIKIGNQTNDSTSTLSPFSVAVSVLNNSYGYNFKYAYRLGKIMNRNLSLILQHHYYTLLKKSIPEYPSINGHVQQLCVGAEIGLLPEKEHLRLIEPYINISLGEKGVNVYRKIDVGPGARSFHLAINNDIGIDFHLPTKRADNRWSLTIFHRLMWQSATSRPSVQVNSDYSPYRTWQSAIGAGIMMKL